MDRLCSTAYEIATSMNKTATPLSVKRLTLRQYLLHKLDTGFSRRGIEMSKCMLSYTRTNGPKFLSHERLKWTLCFKVGTVNVSDVIRVTLTVAVVSEYHRVAKALTFPQVCSTCF